MRRCKCNRASRCGEILRRQVLRSGSTCRPRSAPAASGHEGLPEGQRTLESVVTPLLHSRNGECLWRRGAAGALPSPGGLRDEAESLHSYNAPMLAPRVSNKSAKHTMAEAYQRVGLPACLAVTPTRLHGSPRNFAALRGGGTHDGGKKKRKRLKVLSARALTWARPAASSAGAQAESTERQRNRC